MGGIRFQRSNIYVTDLDRALSFYRDALGFDVTYVLPPNPASYSYEVFEVPRDAVLRFCTLSTETQARVLALTEISGIALTPVAHPRRTALVLEVADPDTVIGACQALGLTVYPEAVLKTNDGRIGREIGVVDFDDNLVVLYKIESRP
jgi:catechol 2,3-dioxygenase-like lactoylglutathione lyase family enzyme